MATTYTPTPAQALLALYGALDHAVGTGNADIEATVARYLPGSTGTNAGWYEQLLVFLGHREGQFTHTATVPDLGQALSVLQQQAAGPTPKPAARKPRKTAKQETAVTAGFSGTPPLRLNNRGRCPRYKKREWCTRSRRSVSCPAGICRTCWATRGNNSSTTHSTWSAA